MDAALRAAFRAACYRFNTPEGELLLKVDEPNARLGTLLRGLGADSMAVLTAFNPQSRRYADAGNLVAQERLQRELTASAYTWLTGRNEDPAGDWPAEDSVLVVGINMAAAQAVAARFDQLAFLWSDATSATPRLFETTGA